MNELPKDPFMLFSFVNMKLRDEYASLQEMCDDMDIDMQSLVDTLAAAGWEYSPGNNKFW